MTPPSRATGDLVPIDIDLGDVAPIQAALRNRRDYHMRQMQQAVPESNVQQHHRDFAESIDRVLRDLSRAADAANRM